MRSVQIAERDGTGRWGESGEGVARLKIALDDGRQGLDGGGLGAAVVHEDDGAPRGADTLERIGRQRRRGLNFGEHGVAVGDVPVEVDEAAPRHFGDELLMDADIIAVDAAAGEAEDLRLDAGGLVDLAEHLVEVLQIRFDRGVYFLVVVRVAVDSKRVARRDDLLHPLEIALLQ